MRTIPSGCTTRFTCCGGVALGLFLTQAVLLRKFCPACCVIDAGFVLASVIAAGDR
jgi:hypothetical protein